MTDQDTNSSNGATAVLPDPEVSILPSPESAADGLAAPDLVELANTRIAILMKLEALNREREEIRKQPDLPADARNELTRQSHELKRLPREPSADPIDQRIAALRRAAAPQQKLFSSKDFEQALGLAKRQWQLFALRNDLETPLLETAAKAACQEPVYRLLATDGNPPPVLYGWAAYAACLETMRKRLAGQRDQLRQQLERETDAGNGELTLAIEKLESLLLCITWELSEIEPVMVGAFWTTYTELAVRLVSGAVPPESQAPLRAFLRYGMIGSSPWLLAPEAAEYFLEESARFVTDLDSSVLATHVLYADEYLDLVARGVITPSIDEDLELNHRGSDLWLRDKMWRQMIAARTRILALRQTIHDLMNQIGALKGQIDAQERQRANLRHGSREYAALHQHIQDLRVQMTRQALAIKHIQDHCLPEETGRQAEAVEKVTALGGPYAPADLARQEVARIHRVCRLCARLKDPFPPFALRDNYRRERGIGREAVLDELREAESCDPTIFKDIAVPARQSSNRTYARCSPYFLLAPCGGFMSYAWNPRSSLEVGRLVFPVCTPRAGMLKTLLHTALADFRWDTSKESAGLDLLTSDTLVAAYCTVRWNYRNRSKEARQKAGLFSHETDRVNWRRHYELYLTSAKDGGKKLFYRCHEIYNIVLRYLDLPEGVKKLQR